MVSPQTANRERARKDKAKRAIAFAMQSRWSEAVATNQSILSDFPDDLEAYNRLGKALAELGRNREAKAAFQQALDISPSNSIARKNLDRLMLLGDDGPRAAVKSGAALKVFIEESGKAGVTSLTKLASPRVLLTLAPGHPVELALEGGGLKVNSLSGEYVGQVEPRLASRLVRLTRGGNRYEATVTSVGEQELTVIIRETYKHPSQSGTVSFPSRAGADRRVNVPSAIVGDGEGEAKEPSVVKDWSNDDTEPGDDEAFSPIVHRVINPADANGEAEED